MDLDKHTHNNSDTFIIQKFSIVFHAPSFHMADVVIWHINVKHPSVRNRSSLGEVGELSRWRDEVRGSEVDSDGRADSGKVFGDEGDLLLV